MPILPREPDLQPEQFFTLPDEEFPWGVAHVRSRQEKTLARKLAERAVPFYLPQYTSKKQRAGRTFTSHLPLFAGYLFFRGGREARDHVVRSGVVTSLIAVADPAQLARELEQIRALQEAGASMLPYDGLVAGDVVRIEAGVFSGYNGVIVREKGSDRLVVSVGLINKAVSIEFDRHLLRKAAR